MTKPDALVALSPERRRLARQALGLDSTSSGRSYRNRYFCSPAGTAYPEWMGMVETGLAEKEEGDERLTFFWLTRRGAEAVLNPGERLCPEDFPADA